MPHDDFTPVALIPSLEPLLHRPRWWIAYSGGVDSHVLLHAVAVLRTHVALPPLTAVHINHQINPHATDWAARCTAVCAALGIDCVIESVRVDAAGIGLEAAARNARYTAFERHMGAGEILLQGHHADDQVETLLLRLLRGSGLAGLASIPRQRPLGRGELLRPLLAYSRGQLLDYARAQGLQWIHDDSNDDPALDRNFLRLRVLPLLAERWPAYRDTLRRVVDNAADGRAAIDEVAAADHAVVADGDTLCIDRCTRLGAARQRSLIVHWLAHQGLPGPSSAQLAQVLDIFEAGEDAEPCVSWPGVEIHRFRGALHALRPLPAPPGDIDEAWRPEQPLRLPGLGELRTASVDGAGLRADRQYRVRNRRGGERCRPLGRAHSQTLKKLLQEYAVPPWLRDRLPLIYCGDELAAVGDIWICEGFETAAGAAGWRIEWNLAV
jgi:tRNA(Ile)-lysidine synthase